MIVVDASVCIAWNFPDQRTPQLTELSKHVIRDGAAAPQLWPVEVTHVVLRAGRRGDIPMTDVAAILNDLRAMNVEIDQETGEYIWSQTLNLAILHGLSVYDATYLELAIRKQLPLATLDDKLIAATRAEGLSVLP